MNKFEKLIEFIINDEDQKARELFHEIVVEKSRDIYESIMDEESVDEMVQGAEVEGMMDEVNGEEAMDGDEEGAVVRGEFRPAHLGTRRQTQEPFGERAARARDVANAQGHLGPPRGLLAQAKLQVHALVLVALSSAVRLKWRI